MKAPIPLRIIQPIVVFLVSSFFMACAGRAPQPIVTVQPGDESKQCKTLDYELGQMEKEATKLAGERNKKSSSNAGTGIAAVLLFPPALFFLDLKDTEKTEYEAIRQRYNHLLVHGVDKNCEFTREPMLTIEQIQAKNSGDPGHNYEETMKKAKTGAYLKNPQSKETVP
jgi:hypothetical protein